MAARSARGAHDARPLRDAQPAEAPSAGRAVVIGGGISGLLAARDLAVAGLDVTVLEASDRTGGCVGTHQVAGLELDSGAESFATRSGAVTELVAELGLAADVVRPAAAGAWLQLPGEDPAGSAQPMPKGGILGIPTDLSSPEIVRALGRAGAARAALDRMLPAGAASRRPAGSLGALVRARMGEQVLRRLVSPVVSGVYSADPDVLDVDSVAPGLRQALAREGSLAAAAASLRAAAPAGATVASLRGGMGRLASALEEELRRQGVALELNAPVQALQRSGAGWEVSAAGRRLAADRVVVATDGPTAVDLLAPVLELEPDARPAPGPGVALVTLVVDQPALDAAPRGTGVLVAREVAGVEAKALTHATAKWQWLADAAGPGTHVLRLSYGRALAPQDLAGIADPAASRPDEDLFAQALADAAALLQVPLAADDVVGWDVVRWTGALPSATVGHRDRVAAVREAAAAAPGLAVVGAWLAGTGLAAVTADTRARIAALLAQPSTI